MANGVDSGTGTFPKPWSAQTVFSNREPWVERTLRNMSVREKVGQMIVAKVDAVYKNDDDPQYQLISRLVSEGKIGGIMFLKGDVQSAGILANHFQELSKVPLLVSADMEKGVAMRLDGATKFSPAMAISAAGNPALARRMAEIVAREARAIGIHQNYAPTVDLNINPANPVINTRSFGDRIPLVNAMSAAVIDGLQSNGVAATAKHFPGHGDVTVDSHLALPVLEGDRRRLENYELKPFRSAIANGVLSVMVGHLAVPKLTGTMEPASLSRTIVTGLLRNELGFKGLIVTDALNMKALQSNGLTPGEVAVRAVQAGNDMLLFPEDPELVFDAVCAAVENGEISEQQIDHSVQRILQMKHWLGLDRRKLVDLSRLSERVGTKENKRIAEQIAEQSLTLLRDRNRTIPLRFPQNGQLVNIILNDRPGQKVGREFVDTLRTSYNVTSLRLTPQSQPEFFQEASRAVAHASAVILTTGIQAWSKSVPSGLSQLQCDFVRSLPSMAPKGTPILFISFGTPYILDAFPEIGSALCAYSENEETDAAILKALKGELVPRGTLPVSLESVKP
ncbi:MAG TPA: glycoside hydrolase family 3 [Chlorobaculum sp.]|uniref:beta-N-acetylhexosaminidase n=1 Tax=Chlorobaculum tepidum (strain ATCC 49652 / DSM 12025 / NBRC 103806 / TLS) TaxID=194439 RepID=Q8KAN2_CHLTE|nr:glycoside hydrolase family 3 protein [Chlorobaculum tepidum]AAM73340.1 beta-N-acetylglucosaminidase [Chlorobaculum tepidum TLS]HBU23455.1 glycoside hydrolase family 3 [Chlorobaculum sp.]